QRGGGDAEHAARTVGAGRGAGGAEGIRPRQDAERGRRWSVGDTAADVAQQGAGAGAPQVGLLELGSEAGGFDIEVILQSQRDGIAQGKIDVAGAYQALDPLRILEIDAGRRSGLVVLGQAVKKSPIGTAGDFRRLAKQRNRHGTAKNDRENRLKSRHKMNGTSKDYYGPSLPLYVREDAGVRQFLAGKPAERWCSLQRYAEAPRGTRDSGLRGLGGKPEVVHERWQLSHCPRIPGATRPGAFLQRGTERLGGCPAGPGGLEAHRKRSRRAPDPGGGRRQSHGGRGEGGARSGKGEAAHPAGARRLLDAGQRSTGIESGRVHDPHKQRPVGAEEALADSGDQREGDAGNPGGAFA